MIYTKIFIILFLLVLPIRVNAQDQESFPFDKECLTFNKATFKVGDSLLDVMKTADFPQYCELYSLSGYQIKQKREDGYFIIGSKLNPKDAVGTQVFLKSKAAYSQDQSLISNNSDISNLHGQWAYFVGPERFIIDKGIEKEFYVFEEIDF